MVTETDLCVYECWAHEQHFKLPSHYYRQLTSLALFDLVVCCYHSIPSNFGNCYPIWQINKSGWVDTFVVGDLANYLGYCAL
jgi:hypothetical protein